MQNSYHGNSFLNFERFPLPSGQKQTALPKQGKTRSMKYEIRNKFQIQIFKCSKQNQLGSIESVFSLQLIEK